MNQNAPSYLGSSFAAEQAVCYLDPELGLFALADAEGSQWDEAASRLAIECVQRASRHVPKAPGRPAPSLEEREQVLRWLTSVMNTINFDLNDRSRADRRLSGVRCSLELLLLKEGGAFLGHIGGSRSYLLRGERVHQLTEDHTYAHQAVAMRQMSREEAAAHPGGERLAQALGPLPYISPETIYFELAPGDVFLLGTRGLHRRLEWSVLGEWMRRPLAGLAEPLVEAARRVRVPSPGPEGLGCTLAGVPAGAPQLEWSEAIIGAPRTREILARCPLFAELTPQELIRVQKMATVRRVATEEIFVREGELTQELLIPLEGECSVWLGGQSLGMGGPSDPSGAVGLIAAPSQVTNRAETPMLLLAISVQALAALRTTDAVLASKLAYGALERALERAYGVARSLMRYREVYGPTP